MHRRKMANRSPYDRVLIVCEGGKTEPHYFRWLIENLRLNRANVVIADKKEGLDPKNLVDYAIKEFNKEKDFDHVYCVFDKDKHANYRAALDKISSVRLRRGSKLHPIPSIPCFEFWLMLHFTYTTRQYEAPLDESDCELVVSDLKRHIPGYEKGSRNFLMDILGKTDEAVKNAKQIEVFHETSGTDNPSIKIYILVEYLKKLKT